MLYSLKNYKRSVNITTLKYTLKIARSRKESLRQILSGQLPCSLQLFIPVTRLSGYMLIIAKFGRKCVLSPDGINRVLSKWGDLGIHMYSKQ